MPFIFLTPAIGWAWPALVPLIGSVASALGYKVFSDPKGIVRGVMSERLDNVRLERVTLAAAQVEVISESLGKEERITLTREQVVLVIRKDATGKFIIEVMGPKSMSSIELKSIGEEFARELVQKFAYHKINEQMERAGVTVLEEKVEADGKIVMQARKWD